MIFQSFLLGNLVSLCMKIINSVVVVGLYYGFLTTFSIGPSYLFLLRAQVMEEGEEGTEKKVSATTGFIMGQLMMFISIYYTPLHLALGRPHTITVLALPYLLFHFFWNNHKHFFDYGSTSINSMRNLSIQCVFLNNLIFQLFNYFILPSSMLARLVNIYMFRCNNKMLFVTSSFVGWLIGHILFMKWVGLVLVWIQQNHSIRSNKYLVSKLRNSMARIFSIFLFITCVYYLGRMPSPIFTKKLKETPETKESEEETDVEIEKTSKTKETKQEEEEFTEEDPSPSLFSEEKEDPDKIQIDETEKIRVNGKDKTKDEFHLHLKEAFYKNSPTYYSGNQDISKLEILKFEKPLLFDYKRWNRPTRYIKNNRFENAVRNEMSQYFFYTCQNDGKQKISFTYPPSLSIFWEMIQRNISLATTEKFLYDDELYNYWIYMNEQKRNSLSNELNNRIRVIDKEIVSIDGLDKKTRLCNDKTKLDYLQKALDPLLNGSYRGIIKKKFSSFININETTVNNLIDAFFLNKIHSVLRNDYNHQKFEHQNSISSKINYLLTLMSQFAGESTLNQKRISLLSEQEQVSSKDQEIFFKFIIDTILTDALTQTIPKRINQLSKKVPRWSYKLITDLEQREKAREKDVRLDHQIRTRKSKRVVIYTNKQEKTENTSPNTTDITQRIVEVSLIRYAQQPNFRRNIIKGSMRAQRRKIVIWKLFQANTHSPLFLDRIKKSSFLSVNFPRLIKRILKIFRGKKPEFEMYDYGYKEEELKEKEFELKEDNQQRKGLEKKEKQRQENKRIRIAQVWDTIPFAQVIRGLMLMTQLILRKYIVLPLLIIAKNVGRLLLFQPTEWSEDFAELNNERHIKCTYNGVQLSETEFPKNWLTNGIQIKIVFPFCLKPWHRSTIRSSHRDALKKKEQNETDNFCFLTVLGTETNRLFGPARKHPSFFKPIFQQFNKKIRKFNKKSPTERKNWIIEILIFLKKKIKNTLIVNPILVFVLREESSERKKEKDWIINNHMIHESSIQTRSQNCTTSSVIEKKMKDLVNRTKTIKNKIEKISKDNRKRNISPSYGTKKFESTKNIDQILKRRNTRLIRQSNSIFKFFRERLYVNIFLYIINIPRINIQLFLESTKNWIDKWSYTNKRNHERIEKTNKKKITFSSTIKKEFLFFFNINNSKITNNSKILSDFSFLSQAYVFYKLSQAKNFDLDKLRFLLKYRGISLFIKNEIKDYFGTQGITHFELKTKKLPNSGMNQWKNWLKLKSNYQYNLSKIKWAQLVPQKWRNKVTKHSEVENTNNPKNPLLLLPYQKSNFKKNYRYDLLSYKFVSYEDKNDLYRYSYVRPFQVNNKQEFSYTYNSTINQEKLIDMWWNMPITNYLGIKNIMDMDIEKNADRKYLDLKIFHFCLKKKVDIENWVNISIGRNENTKTEPKNSQIVDKIDKKDLLYPPIYQEINRSHKKKNFFDWMGMNEEIFNRPTSNLEFWFFSEFVSFYNAYKMKPWIIPINFLFSNSNVSENLSKNKNINRKKKTNPFIPSNEKKSFEFENQNQDENELVSQENLGSDVQENSESVLSNGQKNMEDSYVGSDIKKPRKKKQSKGGTETEIDLLRKRLFLFQARWGQVLDQKLINNIRVYCLLLRLINLKEIVFSAIERKDMNMDIIPTKEDFVCTELIKSGIVIIEPIRLSVKGDGQFIMYQTIGISLVHKSKHQNNQKRYSESVDKKKMGERKKNNLDLFAPEKILSPRRRRELRILISLNSRNNNGVNTNLPGNWAKSCSKFFDENKDLDQDKNTLRKLKFFLWPNYRLEDLACMNRYWFDTTNGSRFSILRIHMYPQLKIHL
uniref:Protein TIC 214 n=1 Tax=Achyranthes bidentata TaxID=384659 RepID=A0A7D6C5S0_9CARY|nr:Ycf1 [Achyranthes bidentata]QLJ93210.1 Ycf1 [Achyranthes bidentata]